MNNVYIVESYDYDWETCLHRLWFPSIDKARDFGENLLIENPDDVLWYNIFCLEPNE